MWLIYGVTDPRAGQIIQVADWRLAYPKLLSEEATECDAAGVALDTFGPVETELEVEARLANEQATGSFGSWVPPGPPPPEPP